MDDARGMNHDIDPIKGDAEQPMGFDRLEALVHQGRGVDRDLGTHLPRRVSQSVRHANRPEPIGIPLPKGASGRSEDQSSHTVHGLTEQALPDRTVLTINWKEPATVPANRLQNQRPSDYKAFLVCERNVLAGVKRREGRGKCAPSARSSQNDISLRHCRD